MKLKYLIFGIALLCFPLTPIYAKYDPLSVPNNRFGIHVADPNDIGETSELVNSSGGDWGYVTFVIQEDNRDQGKWQNVFNQMRSRHLIPIVRLATHIDGDAWTKPYKDSAKDWARFLNELNWPTENRYVVLFNEPNHANEWGRTIDPEEYARTLVSYATILKETSEDFFILPAGLDVSAASDGRSLSASDYLSRMIKAEPSILTLIDGWTSHSYPNPAFSGSPYATGRGTLRSYLWELDFLRQLGLTRTLPVFITETGWIHSDGVLFNSGLLSPDRTAENYRAAASAVWQDPIITAITPFVYSYQGLPFDHFSWRKLGTNTFYPQYHSYQQIPKTEGVPKQREKYTFDAKLIPSSFVAGSSYTVSSLMKNEGQGIFTEKDNAYLLELTTEPKFITVRDPIPDMEPGQFGTVTMHIETPNLPGEYTYTVDIVRNGIKTPIEEGKFTLVPPPSITISLQLGWRAENTAINATVLIYDHQTLIHKFQGVAFKGGQATVEELRNVLPSNTYRVVVLVPYYLPRQFILPIEKEGTSVRMPRMYPLDFNQDGTFNPLDFLSLVKMQPNFVVGLFTGR